MSQDCGMGVKLGGGLGMGGVWRLEVKGWRAMVI